MIAGIKRQPPAGFTLVEVMVALAVVALAVPALLFTLFQQLEGTEYLRDRSMASWVAANRLNELKLVVAKQGAVPEGQLSGETRLAQRDWYWWIEQEGTEVPGFIRVDINVATEETAEPGLHTLTAFISAGSPQ